MQVSFDPQVESRGPKRGTANVTVGIVSEPQAWSCFALLTQCVLCRSCAQHSASSYALRVLHPRFSNFRTKSFNLACSHPNICQIIKRSVETDYLRNIIVWGMLKIPMLAPGSQLCCCYSPPDGTAWLFHKLSFCLTYPCFHQTAQHRWKHSDFKYVHFHYSLLFPRLYRNMALLYFRIAWNLLRSLEWFQPPTC